MYDSLVIHLCVTTLKIKIVHVKIPLAYQRVVALIMKHPVQSFGVSLHGNSQHVCFISPSHHCSHLLAIKTWQLLFQQRFLVFI